MKPTRVLAACVLSASPFAVGAEVRTGDSLADVRNALGAPRGQVKMDGRQVLYYERGEIELQNDTVTRVALRSAEEQMALEAREVRNREERLVRLNQLLAEGNALRDRKMADAAFNNAPLVYQVSYWENFARAYPGVSVTEPLSIARLRLNEQQESQRVQDQQAARIADLEDRLAQAEGDYYPIYNTGYYGRGYRGPAYPPNFGNIRYDFQTTTAAPYETPRGAPYATPHGSPYATPTTIDFNAYYKPAPVSRNDWANGSPDCRRPDQRVDRGHGQVAKRDRWQSRDRY
jgi:hypothetical protein